MPTIPDSSRFWPEGYSEGRSARYAKQQDWLKAQWDMQGEPPHLPKEVIEGISPNVIVRHSRLLRELEFVPLRPMSLRDIITGAN